MPAHTPKYDDDDDDDDTNNDDPPTLPPQLYDDLDKQCDPLHLSNALRNVVPNMVNISSQFPLKEISR